jgi:hypothetical protein
MSVSTVPADPEIEMELVFAVVAAPHAVGVGVAPYQIAPETTSSVAWAPGWIDAEIPLLTAS